MVKTWARHKTTEALLNNGWRLAVGGGWRLAAVGGWRFVAIGGGPWVVGVGFGVGGPEQLSLRAVLNKKKKKDSPEEMGRARGRHSSRLPRNPRS